MLHLTVFAQQQQPWPRNRTTGRVEFNGRLRWPDTVRTELQRQILVRHWYRSKLTNNTVKEIQSFVLSSGTTYGDVPKESCYKLSILNEDDERFNLCFHIKLNADSIGLNYYFFDFEGSYLAIDNGSGFSLEEVLKGDETRTQSVMDGFHEKLLLALKSW
ncbi:hypothetical protein [Hymenobacter psoromatis]|uniref:hypothetical protein n=1 Tax=Hymenobacter psoromatis TaxID=1484116 RepID=UPI001CC1804F|nr:hypothetical protein [Hymenobacter psoromatis]